VNGPVLHYEEVGSTNDVARDEGRRTGARTLSVVADRQTKGRGRAGRTWDSPKSGLYLSTYARLDWPPERAAHLTLAAGLAVRHALEQRFGVAPAIKWPNDLLAPDGSGRKLGGILTETRSEGGRIVDAVIGIGVNLRTPEGGWSVDDAARPVALDAFVDDIPPARELASEVARALENELARMANDEADVVSRARAAMPLWGRRVRGEQGPRVLEGTAKDLAPVSSGASPGTRSRRLTSMAWRTVPTNSGRS
jgi:BirA family biotin operon repressor/biotin-[acetyl-CoA-carboxylase] ligase